MPKILLLTGGGDWVDASAELLVVPEGRDPEEDARRYPGYKDSGERFLRQWLEEELGYRAPNEEEAFYVHDH